MSDLILLSTLEMLAIDFKSARAYKEWNDNGRGGQHTNGNPPELYTMLLRNPSAFSYLERTIKHALDSYKS